MRKALPAILACALIGTGLAMPAGPSRRAPQWGPEDVTSSDLIAEYDPNWSGCTVISGEFTAIPDRWGISPTLDQVVTDEPDTASSGGLRWMDCDGAEALATSGATFTAPGFTVFVVCSAANDTATHTVWSACDLSTFSEQFQGRLAGASGGDPGMFFRRSNAGGTHQVTCQQYVPDQVHLLMVVAHSATRVQVRLDGDEAMEGLIDPADDIQPLNVDTFALGAEVDVNPGTFLTGRIGLVLVYSGVLSEWEVSQVENLYESRGWWTKP